MVYAANIQCGWISLWWLLQTISWKTSQRFSIAKWSGKLSIVWQLFYNIVLVFYAKVWGCQTIHNNKYELCYVWQLFDNHIFPLVFLVPLFLPTFILIISSSNAIHNPKKDQYTINILNSPLLSLIFPYIYIQLLLLLVLLFLLLLLSIHIIW